MADCCSPGADARAHEEPRLTLPLRGVGGKSQASTVVDLSARAGSSGKKQEAGIERGNVDIPAGTFAMGDPFDEGYKDDGETPVHQVFVSRFRISATTVTNAEFAEFVDATGHRTESEIFGTSAVFHLAVRAPDQDILNRVNNVPWWLNVRGADWAHPAGPSSSWSEIPDHPVTHVSHNDALAYCQWAGRRLPTEAEWEYAARGGLSGQRYPWGNDLHNDALGHAAHNCNIWQGDFPSRNTVDDGYLTTAPATAFRPNGYGLYQTSGNVWEWCSDWFLPKYYKTCLTQGTVEDPQGPTIGRGRVMRGGSYLCHDSYCNRYRLAARSSNTPESASGNLGFRTVAL
ncbi:formylglycine-generating enzyme family protein [Arthrobacter sp. FW305-123]|nr:formylglycine-generating enzyme family protein [Arthrobacter sp. FW305-123]